MQHEILGLQGCHSMRQFVNERILQLKNSSLNMSSIFELIFSNDNCFWETTDGNKITQISYREAKKNISKIAKKLNEKLGYGNKEQIVGLYLDNSLEWIEIFWAILANGYVPLLMNKRLSKQVLDDVVAQNNVVAVISNKENFNTKNIELEEIISIEDDEEFEFSVWADKVIFMSSGTTECVKLCVYTGEGLSNQIFNTTGILKLNSKIRSHYDGYIKQLTFLPFYHVFGFIACYLWFAFFGRTFVHLNSLEGETILNTIKKHKVTHIFAVPMLWEKIEQAAYNKIKQKGEKTLSKFEKGLKISNFLKGPLHNWFAKKVLKEVRQNLFDESIQFMISGGGAISKSTLKFFNGLGYHLANGYGMTEIGITSVDLSNNPQTGSIGKPFSTVNYKIENNELFVKGSSIASKIICNGKAEDMCPDKWFATNDLAVKRCGKYYLMGRKDDLVINSSGENLNPNVVEKSIYIAGVKTILIKLDSNSTNKAVLVVQVDRYYSKEKCLSLRNLVIKKLAENNLETAVDEILFTFDQLMLDTEIKVNRKSIIREIQNNKIKLMSFDEIDTSSSLEDNKDMNLINILIKLFSEALDTEVLNTQLNSDFFFDLGGTSLSYFSLLEKFRKEFNFESPLNYNKPLRTINDFYYFIKDNY